MTLESCRLNWPLVALFTEGPDDVFLPLCQLEVFAGICSEGEIGLVRGQRNKY